MWTKTLFISVLAGVLLGPATVPGAEEKGADAKRDAQYRKQLVGVWEDHYQGKRTLTIAENGTATMVVELGGLKALLYASRLEFDMVWSIEAGHLKKRTTGGRPSGKVALILKMMGDHVSEPILELTPDRLLLLDENGKQKYDWRRVRRPPPSAPGKP